jgi:hypothetical protein
MEPFDINSKFVCYLFEILNSIKFFIFCGEDSLTYFKLAGKWSDSKRNLGYRATLYYYAEQHHAYYNVEGRETTIWYKNDDLMFSVLFERKQDAQDFQNALAQAVRHHAYSLEFEEYIESLPAKMPLISRVFLKHYRTEDESSPPSYSLIDQISNRSGTSVADNDIGSERSLQALENLAKLKPHLKLYICHLASKKKYSQFALDPDNIIYASAEFHAYLDGLNTEKSNFPYLALEYDNEFNSIDDSPEEVFVKEEFVARYKVWVKIHFWDADVANVVSLTLKAGSSKLETGAGFCWRSFLHFQDKANAKIYIDIKFGETMEVWDKARINK